MDYDLRDELRRLGDDPVVRDARLPVATLTARLRRRRTARRAAGAAAGTVAAGCVLLGGATAVSRLQPDPVAAPAATSSPIPTTSVAPSPAPTPTSTPTPLPPEPAPAPSAAPTPTLPEPSATAAPPAPRTPPPAAELVHGGTAWGVYVAVRTTPDDPAWVRSGHRLEEMGYFPGEGDVACDRGAPEALGLGLESPALVRSAYFTTQADAELFAELYGEPVLGIVQVTTLCLD